MSCFELCLDNGSVLDGVISQSDAQAADLWRYREGISEADIERMRGIKAVFDPGGILNPGKLLA